jgi:hypothetical protein
VEITAAWTYTTAEAPAGKVSVRKKVPFASSAKGSVAFGTTYR